MSQDGVFKRVAMVEFERILPGPIERAWDFLTDTGKLPGWFGEGTIEPRAGGAVRLMGDHFRGIVTQWKPPHRLIYSINVLGPGELESQYPESYLSLALAPRGNDVVLTLTHLPVLDRFEKQNAMGWHTFLDMLDAALRGEPIEPRQAYMQRNAARYSVDLSNLGVEPMPSFRLARARNADEIASAAALFREYAAWLAIDLSFQGFDAELRELPGKYAPPTGELLLAYSADDEALGCVAVRSLGGAAVCEMKRLYVRPTARGLGIGHALVDAIIRSAEDLGYLEMRLDTLPTMTEALGLYRRLGFAEIPAYYHNPVPGTRFLSRPLDPTRQPR